MSIPAVEPTLTPGGGGGGLRPGTVLGDLTGAIVGSGVTIPLSTVDEQRVAWRPTSLDGWDAPPADEPAQARAGADGSWEAPAYYSARLLTLGGLIDAPTARAREEAAARLARAIPLRGGPVMVRLDEATPKYVTGRRSGRLQMAAKTDLVAEWSASLICPDPRKYGTAQPAPLVLALPEPSGGVAPPLTPPVTMPDRVDATAGEATNAGDYETPPTIRLSGPGRDLGIIDLTSGWLLVFDGELPAGQWIDIDVEAGTALLRGTAPRSPIPGSDIIARCMLAPGTSRLRMLGHRVTDTAPTATITWRHAWI